MEASVWNWALEADIIVHTHCVVMTSCLIVTDQTSFLFGAFLSFSLLKDHVAESAEFNSTKSQDLTSGPSLDVLGMCQPVRSEDSCTLF